MDVPLEGSYLMFKHFENLIKEFENDPKYNGFKKYGKIEVNNNMQLAGNIYRHFPPHFYKAQKTIIDYENDFNEKTTSIFEQDELTIIDIGAGPGTFTLALCDLLYKNKKDGINTKVKTYLIEPNELHHPIANKLLIEFCEEAGIYIEIEIVEEYFPGERCKESLKEIIDKNDFVVYGMCNVMNWLGGTLFFRKADFYKEFLFFDDMNKSLLPLHSVLLSVEIKTLRHPSLLYKLKAFYKQLKEKYESEDLYECINPTKTEIEYINFPKSYYGIKNPGKYSGTYYSAKLIINSAISKMCQVETLKKAYYKARLGLKFEFPCNNIILKLMENSFENNLKIMSDEILKGYKFSTTFLGYEQPKDKSEATRPKVYGDLSDSIAECALLVTIGQKIDQGFSCFSYGNRLNNKQNSEFIYKQFLYSWLEEFMKGSIKVANKKDLNYYMLLDIKSFYKEISQEVLLKKLKKLLPIKDDRMEKFIESMIKRELPNHSTNKGIPQGPVISGFLANVYLDDLDKYIESIIENNVLYGRFVDDILLFGKKEEDLTEIEEKASNYIDKELQLQFKDDKRELNEINELKKKIHEDKTMDNFNKRLKKVIKSFYIINETYYQHFKENKKEFIKNYQKCLLELNININKEWLHRKLHSRKSMSYLKYLLDVWGYKYYHSIEFPDISKLQHATKWVEEFKIKNKKLYKEIENLRNELSDDIKEIFEKYGNLKNAGNEENIKLARRKYKFYTYRASILRVPSINKYIKELIDKPWLYNILVLRNYSELTEDIIKLANNDKEYNKLIAVWALGELNIYNSILEDLLFDYNSSSVLKIECSQTLLKANDSWDKIDQQKLKQEILLQKDKQPILLANLVLLASDELLKSVNEKLETSINSNFRSLDRELNLKALEKAKTNDRESLVSRLEILSEYIKPNDYPDLEPSPNTYLMS